MHDGERHALTGDTEEAAAALGLRTPQPLGRHFNGAEAILLDRTPLMAAPMLLLVVYFGVDLDHVHGFGLRDHLLERRARQRAHAAGTGSLSRGIPSA